ncbi:MAG: hypothetical protein HUU22_18570 [Phycisphaerae bacterium]|nr:hypothetical protein [Phycisphaerae bacterium]NUQ48021.1 hypothetical protein [Phycisphaerae bacterium]
MTHPAPEPIDADWEKADAPRISNLRWGIALIVLAAWIAFLLAMAVHRWIVTLQ